MNSYIRQQKNEVPILEISRIIEQNQPEPESKDQNNSANINLSDNNSGVILNINLNNSNNSDTSNISNNGPISTGSNNSGIGVTGQIPSQVQPVVTSAATGNSMINVTNPGSRNTQSSNLVQVSNQPGQYVYTGNTGNFMANNDNINMLENNRSRNNSGDPRSLY